MSYHQFRTLASLVTLNYTLLSVPLSGVNCFTFVNPLCFSNRSREVRSRTSFNRMDRRQDPSLYHHSLCLPPSNPSRHICFSQHHCTGKCCSLLFLGIMSSRYCTLRCSTSLAHILLVCITMIQKCFE